MPRGPNGEKRPADPVQRGIMVGKILTGEIEDKLPSATRNGGVKGGHARAEKLTPERRREISRMGVEARQRKRRQTA